MPCFTLLKTTDILFEDHSFWSVALPELLYKYYIHIIAEKLICCFNWRQIFVILRQRTSTKNNSYCKSNNYINIAGTIWLYMLNVHAELLMRSFNQMRGHEQMIPSTYVCATETNLSLFRYLCKVKFWRIAPWTDDWTEKHTDLLAR